MQIFNVGNNAVNIYLLDSNSHRLLVDTGFPDTLFDLAREMRKTGFKLKDIDYFLVTHFHPDHAGAIQELKEYGAKFLLFDIQVKHIDTMEKLVEKKWRYKKLQKKDNIILSIAHSGEFLLNLGMPAQVLSTPGHSDDSISLLLDTGEAFTGDLVSENLIMDKNDLTISSWIKLKEKKARMIYPGHGNPYEISRSNF